MAEHNDFQKQRLDLLHTMSNAYAQLEFNSIVESFPVLTYCLANASQFKHEGMRPPWYVQFVSRHLWQVVHYDN